MLGVGALGEHGDPLLHHPLEGNLRPGLVVGLPDLGHQVPGDELRVVGGVAGPAQGGERLVDDPLADHPVPVVRGHVRGRSHAHMVLHLVHCNGHRGHGLHILHVPLAVVTHPDGLGLPLLRPGLKGQPFLLPPSRATLPSPGGREVDQHQVHVLQPQLGEALVQGRGGGRGIQATGDLTGHKILLAGDLSSSQSLAHPHLILVPPSSIHMPVPLLEGRQGRRLRHRVVVLPGADAIQRHPNGPINPLHGHGGKVRREGGGSSEDGSAAHGVSVWVGSDK
mmetsp:Transcript_1013/g.2065  ORF Transcript_1013/g.2065 Transcript_1013/m.2065 type:complete len:280 (-) Transcript_1013:26-865(-)